MLINQIGLNSYFNKITSRQMRIPQMLQTIATQRRMDTVTLDSKYMIGHEEIGIYKPKGNQIMKAISNIEYTQLEPDERLKAEILPASEQTSYTENDALMRQYMKQYRIDGHFKGDNFVLDSEEPVKLMLPGQVTDTDLDSFRQQLNENGLSEDIDWRGVEEDLWNIGVGFDNVERLETKVDYIASRYAVLKDRIQNQYTGDKQSSEMDKLELLFAKAKDEMADSYANSIGGFYENLGQAGTVEDMKASVLNMVEEKTDYFEQHLSQAGGDLNLNTTENQWLSKDDAYVAAQLRESAAISPVRNETPTESTRTPYSAGDLSFAGVYAKNLSSQIKDVSQVWDTEQSDSDLGKFLAKQSIAVREKMSDSDISSKLKNLISNSFEPFIGKFMDALDRRIDEKQELVNKNTWMRGLVRTEHIDRDSVYSSFYNILSNT